MWEAKAYDGKTIRGELEYHGFIAGISGAGRWTAVRSDSIKECPADLKEEEDNGES